MNNTMTETEPHQSFFDLIMNTPVEPAKAATISNEIMYPDLEIACFLAHKDGRMGPAGTYIPNSHPLMVEAGISHKFDDMNGKIIYRF